MTDQELRLSQLQQIPVFALRDKLIELAQDETFAKKLTERFQHVLGLKPRKLQRAIKKCTRAQLVKLLRVCPEITPSEIAQIFRKYRYGTGPSLHLYQFDTVSLDALDKLDALKEQLGQLVESFENVEDGRPMIKELKIIEMLPMPDQSGII